MGEMHLLSHGKLLLSGEYLVLDGAKALAIPTKLGQRLLISENKNPDYLSWESLDYRGQKWYNQRFLIENQEIIPVFETESEEEQKIEQRLLQILKVILEESRTECLKGFHFKNKLEFPRNWGLGSSSTLLNNLSIWSGVNPYLLLDESFRGSGYDIACANANGPLFFRRKTKPEIEMVNFNPPFLEYLFFVHLNQKQNSRDAIQHYRKQPARAKKEAVQEISEISEALVECQNLKEFEYLLNNHEAVLSKTLNQSPVKKRLFPDFQRTVKSLGAWGGDFVMATGGRAEKAYFRDKGFKTIRSFDEMLFKN